MKSTFKYALAFSVKVFVCVYVAILPGTLLSVTVNVAAVPCACKRSDTSRPHP